MLLLEGEYCLHHGSTAPIQLFLGAHHLGFIKGGSCPFSKFNNLDASGVDKYI